MGLKEDCRLSKIVNLLLFVFPSAGRTGNHNCNNHLKNIFDVE